MKKIILLGLLLLATTFSVYSQTPMKANVSLYVNGAFPLGELKEILGEGEENSIGLGVGTSMLFKIDKNQHYTPFLLGLDFSFNNFGQEKLPAYGGMPPIKTTFNTYGFSGLVRFLPIQNEKGFSPFIDGQLGGSLVNARTKVDEDFFGSIDDEEIYVLNNEDNWGFLYGIGAGFFFKKPIIGPTHPSVSFTMKASYQNFGVVEHVIRSSIKVEEGSLRYETKESKTQFIQIQAGVILCF